MDLSFYKLRLCDSDILLVDDLEGDGKDRDWAGLARALLHRRRGAGADRMAIVSKPEALLRLRVFGPEGEGGPCADAALCVARFLLDSGRTGMDTVMLRISGGEIGVDILDSASLGIALGPPLGIPDGIALRPADAASREPCSNFKGGQSGPPSPMPFANPREPPITPPTRGSSTPRSIPDRGSRPSLPLSSTWPAKAALRHSRPSPNPCPNSRHW